MINHLILHNVLTFINKVLNRKGMKVISVWNGCLNFTLYYLG